MSRLKFVTRIYAEFMLRNIFTHISRKYILLLNVLCNPAFIPKFRAVEIFAFEMINYVSTHISGGAFRTREKEKEREKRKLQEVSTEAKHKFLERKFRRNSRATCYGYSTSVWLAVARKRKTRQTELEFLTSGPIEALLRNSVRISCHPPRKKKTDLLFHANYMLNTRQKFTRTAIKFQIRSVTLGKINSWTFIFLPIHLLRLIKTNCISFYTRIFLFCLKWIWIVFVMLKHFLSIWNKSDLKLRDILFHNKMTRKFGGFMWRESIALTREATTGNERARERTEKKIVRLPLYFPPRRAARRT